MTRLSSASPIWIRVRESLALAPVRLRPPLPTRYPSNIHIFNVVERQIAIEGGPDFEVIL